MKTKIALLVIIVIHAIILTQLVFHPYQELFTYPYFVSKGLLPYTQILDQHFPGLLFFPINLATFGMVDEFGARVLQIGIIVLTHLLLHLVSLRLFKSEKLAVLSNLLYLAWQPFFEGWVVWIDSFLPLILLPAFYFTYLSDIKGKSKYYILSGLFLGLAVVFKQVAVPIVAIVGIALCFRKNEIKNILLFGLSALFLPLIMLMYFREIGVLIDFWYWTVTYNLEVFSQYGRKYPTVSELVRVTGVYAMATFAVFHKMKSEKFWILLFLFASLASGYARFDLVHFQPSLVFVVLATVLSIDFLRKKTVGKVTIILYIFGGLLILANFYKGHIGDKIFFFDSETKAIAQRIRDFTDTDDHIFIFGSVPHLYQMSETLPAGDIYIQQYSWFMMISEDEILKGIIRDNPTLVVADRTVSVDGQNIVDYSRKINEYIDENYTLVDKINTTEFLIRIELPK